MWRALYKYILSRWKDHIEISIRHLEPLRNVMKVIIRDKYHFAGVEVAGLISLGVAPPVVPCTVCKVPFCKKRSLSYDSQALRPRSLFSFRRATKLLRLAITDEVKSSDMKTFFPLNWGFFLGASFFINSLSVYFRKCAIMALGFVASLPILVRPTYISDLIQVYVPDRTLRSNNQVLLSH